MKLRVSVVIVLLALGSFPGSTTAEDLKIVRDHRSVPDLPAVTAACPCDPQNDPLILANKDGVSRFSRPGDVRPNEISEPVVVKISGSPLPMVVRQIADVGQLIASAGGPPALCVVNKGTLQLRQSLFLAANRPDTAVDLAQATTRERIDLGFDWRFIFHEIDNDANPSEPLQPGPEGVEAINYGDSQWRTVNIPHDWSIDTRHALASAPFSGRRKPASG